MKIHEALKKIIEKHGKTTYAEVDWINGCTQRLDLAHMIHAREDYEHDNVYQSPRPMPRNYKVSMPEKEGNTIHYRIYRASSKSKLLYTEADVYVFPGYEYADYKWQDTFDECKYPILGIPWWKKPL